MLCCPTDQWWWWPGARGLPSWADPDASHSDVRPLDIAADPPWMSASVLCVLAPWPASPCHGPELRCLGWRAYHQPPRPPAPGQMPAPGRRHLPGPQDGCPGGVLALFTKDTLRNVKSKKSKGFISAFQNTGLLWQANLKYNLRCKAKVYDQTIYCKTCTN